jgi:RNA polymerase sigma-70 factor (ECF subfamily)
MAKTVEIAMKRLNPRERSALIMKYTQGISYAEIAEVTKSSVPAIESLLMRAKGKLRKWLERENIAL